MNAHAPSVDLADLRRRQRRCALLAVGLCVVIGTALALSRRPAGAQGDSMAEGKRLFRESCVSCHAADGTGVRTPSGDLRGPDITTSGRAGAYYMLSTGRMPLGDPDDQPHRKEPAFSEPQIRALVDYVGSFGDGPALPGIDLDDADLARGGELFRGNCQACHSASGAGGALSYGRAAPSLADSTRLQVAAAVRSGPGQMPTFGASELSHGDLVDVVAYVQYLRDPADPGGLAIGRVGPVPEGFVAWAVGVVLLLACVFWIGTRSPVRRRPGAATHAPAPEGEP